MKNEQNAKNKKWLIIGFLSAFAVSSIASVPRARHTGSMVQQQDVSEIRAKRHQELTFDQDVKRLSAIQGRYKENLPLMKRTTKGPKKTVIQPISKQSKSSKAKRANRG